MKDRMFIAIFITGPGVRRRVRHPGPSSRDHRGTLRTFVGSYPKQEAPMPGRRQARDEGRVVIVRWGASGSPRTLSVTFTEDAPDVKGRLAYPAVHNDWTPRGGDERPIFMIVERYGSTNKGIVKGWHTDLKVVERECTKRRLAVEQKQKALEEKLDRSKPPRDPDLPGSRP